jgi:hypothetical protein
MAVQGVAGVPLEASLVAATVGDAARAPQAVEVSAAIASVSAHAPKDAAFNLTVETIIAARHDRRGAFTWNVSPMPASVLDAATYSDSAMHIAAGSDVVLAGRAFARVYAQDMFTLLLKQEVGARARGNQGCGPGWRAREMPGDA